MLPLLVAGVLTAMPTPQADPGFLRTLAETKNFSRGRPSGVTFIPDGKSILFLQSGPRSSALGLFRYDVATGKAEELVTPAALLGGGEEQLSVAEKARRERLRQTERGFTSFQLAHDGKSVLVPLSGKLFQVDLASRQAKAIYAGGEPALDPQLSPDGHSLAYVRGTELHVTDLATGKERALTQGGSADLLHGVAEFVAQEELGRYRGYWWSPDSKQLAYAEVDQREVEHFTIADPAHPEKPGDVFAYPRPGKANARVRVGVLPASGGPTTWLAWDTERYPYLARLHWEQGAPLTLVVLSRDQRELSVQVAQLPSGKLSEVWHQSDPAFLSLPKHEPGWTGDAGDVFRWLPGAKSFLALHEAKEGTVLELHNLQAQEPRTLLGPRPDVRELLKADDKEAWVLAGADALERHLFRVPLDGSAPTQVTRGPAEHTASFAQGAEAWVDTWFDEHHLSRSEVWVGGKRVGELPSRAEEPPFAANVEFTSVSVGGAELPVAILRPRDFKKGQRYPVLDSVYGGPHFNSARREPSRLLTDQWYADQGFIVLRIDNRGTPRHGRDWETAVSGELGSVPLDDQAAAVQALVKRYPEMDGARVGIYGWSFGGYLSTLAVMRRPDVFKAGVAGAPVVDWADYDTAYTERYLGTPQADAEAYRKANVLTWAKDLSRPLLVIHGTADDNVYFFHSLKLMDALFQVGKSATFAPLAGRTHVVADAETKERINAATVEFLRQHLGGP